MDKETIKQFLKQQAEHQRLFQQQQQEFLNAIIAAFTTQKQQPDVTNIINSLSNLISTFHYCPDDGETFDAWFDRNHDIIEIDGKDLDDATRIRIVVSKLENKKAEQFRSFILPKTPADVNFNVATLKKLFNQTKSLARLRYELLSRIPALRELERSPELKLTKLTDRLDQVISLRADADFIGSGSHDIHAIRRQANKPKPKFQGGSRPKNARTPTSPRTSATSPPSPCSRCGDHTGDGIASCHTKQSATAVTRRDISRKYVARDNNAVFIAQSSTKTQNRIYTTVSINGTPIKMQLDTEAEVTLLNHDDWIKLNRPKLRNLLCHEHVNITRNGMDFPGQETLQPTSRDNQRDLDIVNNDCRPTKDSRK
ncbi:unnamed protein product [Caenorhabditis bovis]|uniref:DUF7083 domain-containing protein n=1 Tax=Caenorhabditis bovis TaxID=2654633 RepID=A0A8S1F5P9_9PELO|nr:unnamed protein product [Caenorhabditis bovis]